MPLKNIPLLQQISKVAYLKKAWKQLNTSNKKSSGPSKVSIKEFESNLNNNIKALSSSLLAGNFKFSTVKGVALAKEKKGYRPLLISEIQDRIVHKALAMKLNEKLARKYRIRNICSFAYQKELSIQHAVVKMVQYYQQGFTYVLEADIKNFFPTVNRTKLLADITGKLTDDSLNSLLQGSLNQEVGNREELMLRDRKIFDDIFNNLEDGIPTGNALSPLLANIFLADFDQRMIREKIKMIRYADDFIIMCRTRKNAEDAYGIAVEELQTKLGLELYPLKAKAAPNEKISRILMPASEKFNFLSIRFDGTNCSVSEKKVISILTKIKNLSSPSKIKELYPKEKLGLLQVMTKIKNALEGWIAAYSFLDIEGQIIEIDKHVNIVLLDLFTAFGFQLSKTGTDEIRTQTTIKTDQNENTSLGRNSNIKRGFSDLQRKAIGIPPALQLYDKTRNGSTFKQRLELVEIKHKRIRLPKADYTAAPF